MHKPKLFSCASQKVGKMSLCFISFYFWIFSFMGTSSASFKASDKPTCGHVDNIMYKQCYLCILFAGVSFLHLLWIIGSVRQFVKDLVRSVFVFFVFYFCILFYYYFLPLKIPIIWYFFIFVRVILLCIF